MPESLNPATPCPVGDHRRHRSPVRHRRAFAPGLLVVLLVTLGSLIWAPAASAHDELLRPAAGQQGRPVHAADRGPAGLRRDGPGHGHPDPGHRAQGQRGLGRPRLGQPGDRRREAAGGLGDGVYRVDWRVTSSDGHPVSGTYTFTLKAAPAATTRASVISTASSTTSACAYVTVSASASPSASPSASSTASSAGSTGQASSSGSGGSGGSGSSAGLAVGLLVAAAAVGGIAFALLRRGRGASTSNERNQNS